MRLKALSIIVVAAVAGCSARQPRAAFEVERDVTYARRDDGDLRADIYRPVDDRPHPGVLLVHPGSWRHGSKRFMKSIGERLAEHGYVAVAINYRLTQGHRFPAQLYDCKEAVRWMRRNSDKLRIEPDRIGGFGYSAGGHLVALLATTDADDGLEGIASASDPPTRIEAAVAGAAPIDLRRFPYNPYFYFLLGGSPTELPLVYDEASPVTFVTADDPPMFFYHGRDDWWVDVTQSELMASSLQHVGVPAELYETTGGHLMTFIADDESVRLAVAFLDRWLKDDNRLPALAKQRTGMIEEIE